MKTIKSVTAVKLDEGKWRGKIIIISSPPYVGLTLVQFSRHMKKLLRNRYPLAKKSIKLQRAKSSWSRFYFRIDFTDDAEEAEFIMTINTLEGLVL